MRKFLERAMEKVPRMNDESIRGLLGILADENERLEAVLDSMLDGIVVCDSEHIPVLINKSSERLLPFIQGDIFSVPLWDCLKDDTLAQFFQDTLLGEETVLDREFALDTKSGTRILSISVSALVKDRKIQGTLVHAEDTTDKRKKEARLRRAESLASLTTLAAGVAHEIKNPLASISIHVQLLRKAFESSIEPGQKRWMDILDEEIERLNKIVIDFLFAVRPMDIVPINDDLNAVVNELYEFVHLEAEQNRVSMTTECEKSLPLLPIDRRYIKQALLNLLKNSLGAMPGGGKLKITTSIAGDEVHLSVMDTGSGIPEDRLEKIFEPYYTTRENGTGLGLTLAYKIIKEHGGDITVKSKPGSGTIFTISLPLPQSEQKLIEAASINIEGEH